MTKKRLLKNIVLLMFFIFFVDILAKQLVWYYSIWYFDMIMHFLGGLWLGLFFLYVFYNQNNFSKQFVTVISCVFLVGILWEVFEFFLGTIAHDLFNIEDTLSDIFFDLSGGILVLFYFFKKTIPVQQNTVQ